MDDTWEALGGLDEPQEAHKHSVRHDRFDARSHEEALVESSGLRTQRNWATREFDYAGPFLEDLFFSLLQPDPRVRAVSEMDVRYVPNREMVAKFLQSREWQELRGETAHHVLTSAMAMLSMNEEIRAALQAMQRARDLAEEAQEALDELAQAAASGQPGDGEPGDGGPDGDTGDGGDQPGEGQGESLQELVAKAETAKQIAQAAAESAAASVAAQMRAGAHRAAEQIREESQLANAFGIGDGELKSMPAQERAALMERLRRNRLVKFIDLIGAMRAMAEAQWRRQVEGVPSQIAGVEIGNDLHRLVPSELMALTVPALRMDWTRRFVEHSLMTWQVRDNERLGRGPIVVVCDESGSMRTADIGGVTREAWSKALCMAVTDIARRQGRAMYYVGFSTANQQWQVPARDEPWTVESTLAMAEHFFDGGTHYERPLGLALGMALHWFQQGKARADIVFISDDAYTQVPAAFLEEWQQERERMSVGCHGILIGSESSEAMRALCDTLRPLVGVVRGAEVDAAADVIGGLLK